MRNLIKLRNILHSTKYCGICLDELKKEEMCDIDNNFCVVDNDTVSLQQIIWALFGTGSSNIILSNYLCKICRDSATSAYEFIHSAKCNAEIVGDYLVQLYNKSQNLVSFYTNNSKYKKKLIIILDKSHDNLEKNRDCKSKGCKIIKIESKSNSDDKIKVENATFKRIRGKNIEKSIYDKPLTVEHSDREEDLSEDEDSKNVRNNINNRKQLFHTTKPLDNFSKVLKCQFCNVKLQSRSKYINHMMKRHPQFGDPRHTLKPLTCKICQRQFLYPKSLVTHWETHNPCKKYKCVLCEVEFESKEMFSKHIRTIKHKLKKKVNNTQPKLKDCSVCHKQFNDITLFNTHMAKHGPNVKHKCKLCNLEFDRRLQYERHVKKLEHKAKLDPSRDTSRLLVRPKNMHCSICQMEFTTYKAIREHISTHRPNEKHKCEPCSLEFNSRQEYIKHSNKLSHIKRLDADKKLIYKCDLCEYTSYNKCYFKIHVDKHSGVIYSCHVCGKQFQSPLCLKIHTDIHAGKRKKPGDNSKRICDLCGRVLCGPSAMKKHMRLHTGERPYKCNECEKSFVSASQCSTHKRKTHMEKSISCPLCGKMFYLLTHMRGHVKKTHWKSSDKFDYRKLKGLTEEDYDLFKDKRKIES